MRIYLNKKEADELQRILNLCTKKLYLKSNIDFLNMINQRIELNKQLKRENKIK